MCAKGPALTSTARQGLHCGSKAVVGERKTATTWFLDCQWTRRCSSCRCRVRRHRTSGFQTLRCGRRFAPTSVSDGSRSVHFPYFLWSSFFPPLFHPLFPLFFIIFIKLSSESPHDSIPALPFLTVTVAALTSKIASTITSPRVELCHQKSMWTPIFGSRRFGFCDCRLPNFKPKRTSTTPAYAQKVGFEAAEFNAWGILRKRRYGNRLQCVCQRCR